MKRKFDPANPPAIALASFAVAEFWRRDEMEERLQQHQRWITEIAATLTAPTDARTAAAAAYEWFSVHPVKFTRTEAAFFVNRIVAAVNNDDTYQPDHRPLWQRQSAAVP